MESALSLFETSEILANLISSTSLLLDSWRLCEAVNKTSAAGAERFAMHQIGSVGYVAFSGAAAEIIDGMSDLETKLMPLSACDDTFSVIDRCGGSSGGDGEAGEAENHAVMVHSGLLKVFWDVYSSPSFKTQMQAMMERSKSIILTGHSIGGTTASLMTLSLLCHLQTFPSPLQVLCITFGSPLLGNAPLSRSIQRQKWDANFCHVVLKHDIVPRLFFAPLSSLDAHLLFVLQCCHLSAQSTAPSDFDHLLSRIPNQDKAGLFNFIATCTQARAGRDCGVHNNLEAGKESFCPFGSYLFCSEVGILCLENAVAVVGLMCLMLATADANSCILDHFKYREYVEASSYQFLQRKDFKHGALPEASYEAGLAFAVESSGLAIQEAIAESTKHCLRIKRGKGLPPNLNCAALAIRLSKITPNRAQIEWYKACCDKLEDQMGYYDSFKKRQALRRDSEVNLFRLKLAGFWDNVIKMIDNNTLPHDLHKRAKWVNASRFYQLLVEPLDIADYYRSGTHRSKGHYIQKGRPRRHQVFDKWWRAKHGSDEKMERTKFAGLTEDPCFWARVEEARESLEKIKSEGDSDNLVFLWENIRKFELYAQQLIQNKEVSVDVLAKNSSYSLWVKELAELRSQPKTVPYSACEFY